MTDHPTPAEFDRFLRGTLSRKERRRVFLHLLAGCGPCARAIAPTIQAMAEPERLEDGPEVTPIAGYDRAIDRALAAALGRERSIERERAAAARIAAAIASGRRRADLTPAERRLLRHGLVVVELLLAESRALRYRDPREMVQLAELATLAADRLDPRRYGLELVNDQRARAWAELANAHRVLDDLAGAERAMQRAMTWQQRGTGDPLLLARIADLGASLHCDRRRFADAFEMLEGARRIYEASGDEHQAGRTLVKMAHIAYDDGEPEQAVRLVLDGLGCIEPERDPGLQAASLQNFLLYLVECGRFSKARTLLWRFRMRELLPDEVLTRLRLCWIEGKIHVGLADLEAAEKAFLEAKQGFDAEEQPYESGFVSFDLATVWLRQGKTAEVKRLVAEVHQTFVALEIDREAVAAVALLVQACEQERASVDFVRSVAGFLKELERRPGLRFKP